MKPVEIYTTPICGFCRMAKSLLDKKGVSYTEIDVMMNPSKKSAMVSRANGGRSVPQIFIDDAHVGGCDDLYDLERAGRLDGMLAA
ncbi:MAG: glutaredoxin 3 [Paracoccaceae bacterium]|nr:glutaredoxin 3 [Paracoccaceae bacterium]MDG1368798.1 glutaredoxin 3 [Paracoccaceae bacterium]